MLETLLDALLQTFTLYHLLYLAAGVVFGLMIGIIPGLGGSAGLALTLPFVIGVEPSAAIGLMIGLQSVTATSDTFPAVLVGVPGTASAQATVVDGFEMSKQGRAAEALGAAFSASLIGGLFGAVVLTVAIGFAEPIILAFGLAEQMMLVVLAVALIGSLTGTNVFKGLAAAAIGMLIGTIGSAPTTAMPRFTFDSIYLLDNIKVVLVGLGLFAVPRNPWRASATGTHRGYGSETYGLGNRRQRDTFSLVVDHSMLGNRLRVGRPAGAWRLSD